MHGSHIMKPRSGLLTNLSIGPYQTKAQMIGAWKAARVRLNSAAQRCEYVRKERISTEFRNVWITEGSADGWLWHGLRTDFKPPIIVGSEDIIAAVANACEVPVREIKGPWRSRHIVRARMIAVYLLREMRPLSFPLIGRLLGNRDHTTIMHSYETVKANPDKFEPHLSIIRRQLGMK